MSISRWLRSRSLLFKFGIIHGAGSLFTLAVILLTRVFVQQLASGSVAINYAGQERYRSYELLFLVNKMVEDPSERRETRELLRLEQAEFERILTGLRTGDPNLSLDAPPEGPVTARLAAFDLKYREEIEPVLDRVIAVEDESEIQREREKLVGRVPGFVLTADRVEACHFDGERRVPGSGLTASVGYAALASADADDQRTVQEADQALYSAKAHGRNRVACYG